MNAPDLTQHPPRSPRVRLGGYVILPRLLDKCRALLAGKNGEYKFNCPLDQMFFEFAGVNAEALSTAVATGMGDGELLQWVQAHSTTKPGEEAVAAWSAFREHRAPASVDLREHFHGFHAKLAPQRDDIVTWFDLLDLDDYVSFGGKP